MEGLFVALEAWLATTGAWAYVIAPTVMAMVAVLPIPAEAPAMINGALFGPLTGTVITWVGALLGAALSFEIARALGRPVAARLIGEERLVRADQMVDQAGWTGLLVLRLLPVVAFTAINWAAGLTTVSRFRFLWTTAIGILPGAIVFTASGSGLAAILKSGSAPLSWIAVALVASFIGFTWWRSRKRRRDPHAPLAEADAGN